MYRYDILNEPTNDLVSLYGSWGFKDIRDKMITFYSVIYHDEILIGSSSVIDHKTEDGLWCLRKTIIHPEFRGLHLREKIIRNAIIELQARGGEKIYSVHPDSRSNNYKNRLRMWGNKLIKTTEDGNGKWNVYECKLSNVNWTLLGVD